MTNKILYVTDDGLVVVVSPSDDVLRTRSVYEVGVKDVPAGKPFAIVDAAGIPSDASLSQAWTVDESLLTDGVGGEFNEFNSD